MEKRINLGIVLAAFGALAVVAVASAGTACGETLWDCDFSEFPRAVKADRYARVANGELRIGTIREDRSTSFELVREMSRSFGLAFRARMAGSRPGNCNWGLNFFGPDGLRLQVYFGGKVVGYHLFKGCRHAANGHIQTADVTYAVGEGAAMDDYELTFEEAFLDIRMNGRSVAQMALPAPMLPLQKLAFYAYNCEVALDDVKVSALDATRVNDSDTPVFALDFENGTVARSEKGAIEPFLVHQAQQSRDGQRSSLSAVSSDGQLTYGKGVAGAALWLKPEAEALCPVYDVGGLLGAAGGVSLWVKMPRKGFDPKLGKRLVGLYCHVVLTDEKGRALLRLGEHGRLLWADLKGLGGKSLDRFVENVAHHDAWIHFAVTWTRKGRVRLYVNGLPYFPSNTWLPDETYMPGLDFSRIRYLRLDGAGEQLVDGVRLFRRELAAKDVYEDYRSVVPADVVLPRGVLTEGRDETVELLVAPGGRYTRPIPGGGGETMAKLDLRVEVLAPDGSVIASQTAHVDTSAGERSVKLPVGRLLRGEYAVRFGWKTPTGAYQDVRSLRVLAAVPPAKVATDADVEKGRQVFERVFDDPKDPNLLVQGTLVRKQDYLELGAQKGERFSTVVTFGPDVRQKPCIVEIEWPDDAVRMCGFYLYMENPKGECYRDRLQGGVHAGHEYPNSGKMVTTRYVFWPQCDTYSFELRTMANGYPAAVRAIRAWEVKGGELPKLAVRSPEGLEPRRLGTGDEDQTLNTTLATAKSLEPETMRLLDYMDYTGMNVHHAPVLRYNYSYYPFPGSNGVGMYPYVPGAYNYVAEALAARGKAFVPIVNCGTLQEVHVKDVAETDAAARGLVQLDKDRFVIGAIEGRGAQSNPAHPACVKALCRHVEDFAAAFAHEPNVEGFSAWRFLAWNGEASGYDDWTVNSFSSETGVRLPDPDRRYDFLNSAAVAPKWYGWRAEKVLALVKAMRATLDRYNPSWKLFLPDCNGSRELALIERRIAALPNTHLCAYRRPTSYRHDFHWGRAEGDLDFRLYDYAAVRDETKRRSNELVNDFYTYYETFVKSQRKTHGCYFQSLDVKPWGRYMLKEYAFLVGAVDALEIASGGQPFPSWGADAEYREFAKAYTALPRVSFDDVKTPTDVVVVRRKATKNGTYVYAVNQTWGEVSLSLGLSATDLSTGARTDGEIRLKPYELKSFLSESAEVAVGNVRTDPALPAFYAKRRETVVKGIAALAARGVEVAAERTALAAFGRAADGGNFAEAHRLAFAPILNRVMDKLANLEIVAEQSDLVKRHVIRVNCGSGEYARTRDGRLFFPDLAYDALARYGFEGKHNGVTRNTTGLADVDEAELFKSEAYDCDGWRFDLPNGRYKVVLHMKVGYRDDFKKDTVVFTVYANGRALFTNLDFHVAQDGDFMQPVRREFPVEVTDGRLVLKLEQKRGLGGNIRLMNGIEVMPDK